MALDWGVLSCFARFGVMLLTVVVVGVQSQISLAGVFCSGHSVGYNVGNRGTLSYQERKSGSSVGNSVGNWIMDKQKRDSDFTLSP
jgi:hypothetical protein